jgi:hypothetical protein
MESFFSWSVRISGVNPGWLLQLSDYNFFFTYCVPQKNTGLQY